MKNSFILPLIMALGIACSAPKAEAVNWSKIARAGIYGTGTLISGLGTIIPMTLALLPMEKDDITVFLARGMAIPCGILTLICAKKFIDVIRE